MNTKICSRCEKEKIETDFYRDKYKNGGYASTCKMCIAKERQHAQER